MKTTLAALAVCCWYGWTAPLLASRENDGYVILGKVAAAYAAVTAYQDSGVVLTHDPRKDRPDEIIFQMTFMRQDLLRFDWVAHHPHPPLRHIKTAWSIWPDGSGAHLMAMGKDKPKPPTGISDVVKSAMGVSRGSSSHVPRLLTPTITSFSLVDLADLRLAVGEVFEGAPCYRLEGKHPRGDAYQIWVGETDFFIRRIMRQIPNIPPTEEIHRYIRINDQVSMPGPAFKR